MSDANSLLVFLSGVLQTSSAFTFPSVTLGSAGIDIGDNATKLLLNFESENATDESDIAQTEIPECRYTGVDGYMRQVVVIRQSAASRFMVVSTDLRQL